MKTNIPIPAISGYKLLEKIYCGSRTLVYRGIRKKDSIPVIIKILASEYPSFNELLQFRNQYTIIKNLNIPGIVYPISLESCGNSYILVMKDFGGVSLSEYISACFQDFFSISLQLVEILHHLHQNRVIHKDIKPANILINPETKQVKLIDFSIASLLPKETQEIINPNVLEGTLAYISPEQTGRMNRGIDYRSDFYALGVTLFELLTGELPFKSDDAMELVHCHIAQQPPAIKKIHLGKERQLEEVPQVLSDIVMKLMAKNAEDRYQSSLGLKHDLEVCFTQLQETGKIASFQIAQRDICDKFIIPEKLYGRENEVEQLLAAFNRVAGISHHSEQPDLKSNNELILVAGFSGIGKTAVVKEVYKPILKQRGYFVKGKFDQFNRNIPLDAFVQAFRHLMAQLLTESEAEIQQWQDKLLQALGDNAQVIVEVIPELEIIIGKQLSVPELSGAAAQNRFNLLFQKFIQVFTTKEHPLVIFLDDLQWADSASLKLMQLLMSESDSGYLLLIGAYRDNEVFPAHPLMLTLDEVNKTGAIVNTITLQPLSQNSLNQLVADTLSCPQELAQPLTKLIFQKTKGNPFFSSQFLKNLHEEELITFDLNAGYWQCYLGKVREAALTDDVVIFMALRLQKLPEKTLDILKLAACIGNQFDLSTLAIISQQSEVETATVLWKALQETFILPQSEVYKFYIQQEQQVNPGKVSQVVNFKFFHDRVQQAAYSLIPEQQKQKTHLQIGRSLLNSIPINEQAEHIFDIINQLNIGRGLIDNIGERTKLAQLNLIAGKKAKISTAYSAAVEYALIGLELLNKDSWKNQYQLTLELHELVAEAAYLSGNFEQMQQFSEIILQYAQILLDKVRVYEIRITAGIVQGKQLEAIKIARSILQQLNINFPEQPTPDDVRQGFEQVLDSLQGKSIADLIHLPIMNNRKNIAAMKILMRVIPAAFQSDPVMVPLITFEMVKLSIKHGNTDVSAYGYSLYGLLLCGAFGDIQAGCEFGKLALGISSQFNTSELKAKILTVVNAHVVHWQQHIRETLSPVIEGYTAGLETGDLEYAGYCAYIYPVHSFWLGKELQTLETDFTVYIDSLRQIKQQVALNWNCIYQQTVLNLQCKSEYICSLIGTAYDEQIMLPLHQQANDLYTINHLFINKLLLCYLFERYDMALNHAEIVENSQGGVTGLIVVPLFYFYDSLLRLALYPKTTVSEQQAILERIQAHQQKLQVWANHAPMNHQHKYDLVSAEKSRILGQKIQAIELYDKAIAGAKTNEYIQEEGLANELAAKFYIDWGREKVAAGYMQAAYYCYARWGAKAKTDDLEQRYPDLLHPILHVAVQTLNPIETLSAVSVPSISNHSSTITNQSSSTSINTALDLTAVLKASQALSGTIQINELLCQLTQIALQNSGGDGCVLLLPNSDGELYIEAIATPSKTELYSQPLQNNPNVPTTLIHYVKNTKEVVVIDNLNTDLPVIGECLLTEQPKSVLCLPILNQGHLIGILYLKNKLTSGVFSRDRIIVLNFLCTQAAISLENARLYSQEQQKNREITLKEAEYRSIFENVNDGLSICDLETGQIIASNPTYCQMYGYTQEEFLSLIPSDFIHSDYVYLFGSYLLTLNAGQEFYTQCIGKRKDCSYFDIEVKAVPFIYKGKPHGLTVVRDISKQKAALRQREQAEASVIQKSQELENTLQELKQAQLQMVQNEKLATLGNLVAGVAHEVNNPIGFLKGSVSNAEEYMKDLFAHIKCYEESYPIPEENVNEHAEEVDLEFIREDLPKLLDSMKLATARIQDISTSLRTFSRADTSEKLACNIHEGIDSTILILKYRLKADEKRPAIEVIKKYGQLPPIKCFLGQLNQVFMNIIANAIDALDSASQGKIFTDIQTNLLQIIINTELCQDGDAILITIKDNALGMPESIRERIFDNLFTTKGVGKGTGLGLAIAKQIVEEIHNGKLSCKSTLGKGTEFIIELPI
ncbi:PAS domain S-box [Rivularia sp. PCC 7116]|uniref:AAA family ATPase n=1 Tax=Rivularia sp. PCC 7116 TaxID=373994 RepID=UPI00029F4D48|nr:AAA family ATPase [Rivularia sp. PCC 7116]AFY56346.1 PAS domain S-box [Rivularia sp. PCC 7116]